MPAWPFLGAALTALKDGHLSLAEWQALIDWLKSDADERGDLTTLLAGTDLAAYLAALNAAQAAVVGLVARNLRVDPAEGGTNWQSQVRVRAEQLGIGTTVVSDVDVTIDLAATGPGGRDTGSETADTWYYIWIGLRPDTLEVTGVFSTAETVGGLTLSGSLAPYTEWRRVGAAKNKADGHLRPFFKRNLTVELDMTFGDALVTLPSGGTATTAAAVDVSEWVPPTARLFYGRGTVGNDSSFAPTAVLQHGDTTLAADVQSSLRISANDTELTTGWVPFSVSLNDSREFFYFVVNTGSLLEMMAAGYEDGA